MVISGVVWSVQQTARARGLESARDLMRLTGLDKNTCTALWGGRQARADLTTLAILCKFLECTPGDLLVVNAGVVVEVADPAERSDLADSGRSSFARRAAQPVLAAA